MSILDLHKLWQDIEESDLPASVQLDLLHMLIRLTRRATRWLLRNRRHNLNCSDIIEQFTGPVASVLEQLPELHEVEWINLWSAEKDNITKLGVTDALASRLAASDSMFISLGVVDTALQLDKPVQQVAKLYFKLGELLSLDWFMAQIVALHPENRWEDLARESYVDDLEGQRRRLTASLVRDSLGDDLDLLIEGWQEQQVALIERWKFMIKDLRHGPTPDFAMISVALRELLDLVQASIDGRG
jgi:glutamate dehydrogenase